MNNNGNNIDINNPDPQCILTGHIETNRVGGEVIKFNVNLGLFQLKVIVTVPCEGETEAPVYVKWRIRPDKNDQTPSSKPEVLARKGRRNRDSQAA